MNPELVHNEHEHEHRHEQGHEQGHEHEHEHEQIHVLFGHGPETYVHTANEATLSGDFEDF